MKPSERILNSCHECAYGPFGANCPDECHKMTAKILALLEAVEGGAIVRSVTRKDGDKFIQVDVEPFIYSESKEDILRAALALKETP